MDGILEILYLVGSTLGIISFFDSVVKPIMKDNYSKWVRVEEEITDGFLINLRDNAERGKIYKNDLNRLLNFEENVRNKRSYLLFKFPIKDDASNYLEKLRELILKLENLLSSPAWIEDEEAKGTLGREHYKLNENHSTKKTMNINKIYLN